MAKLHQKLQSIDPHQKYDPIAKAAMRNDPLLHTLNTWADPRTVTTPQVMPMPTDEDVKRAKRLQQAAQLQRTGRASTILSQPAATGDQLGA